MTMTSEPGSTAPAPPAVPIDTEAVRRLYDQVASERDRETRIALGQQLVLKVPALLREIDVARDKLERVSEIVR